MQYRLLILANVCLCSCYHESSVVTMFNTKGTGKTNAPVEYISDAGQISNDSTINYKSFMFSIKNISDSAIWLGRTFSVYFVNREGRNREGEWVKIDEKLCDLKTCRTGEPTILLKPNEIAISKVRRYQGNFATDFRLVFGYDGNVVYSNIFRDSIDDRAFFSRHANK